LNRTLDPKKKNKTVLKELWILKDTPYHGRCVITGLPMGAISTADKRELNGSQIKQQ
jgi:hypothetical protein